MEDLAEIAGRHAQRPGEGGHGHTPCTQLVGNGRARAPPAERTAMTRDRPTDQWLVRSSFWDTPRNTSCT
jgi:hypothetical protein